MAVLSRKNIDQSSYTGVLKDPDWQWTVNQDMMVSTCFDSSLWDIVYDFFKKISWIAGQQGFAETALAD